MHKKPCSSSCWSSNRLPIFSLACLLAFIPVHAISEQNSCAHPALVTTSQSQQSDDGQTRISADRTQSNGDGISVFEGDVVIAQDKVTIKSQRATYNHQQNSFILEGDIQLDNGSMQMIASNGNFDANSETGTFDNVDYIIDENGLRGSARQINTSTANSQLTLMQNSSITSCPKGNTDWLLQAERIEIDHVESYGKADDVSLEFMGVTFFYTPYMEFPVGDRRRSGLLAPEWSNSDSRGFELVLPWYWNIAPNMDAVIAPHLMSERGLQLDTHFRLLTRSTMLELENAYLHEDDVTGDTRYHSRYRQQTRFNDSLKLDIDINDVSDINYFDEFSNNLSITSLTHLDRSARLTHARAGWRNHLLVQTYETVDSNIAISNRPYRKVPELSSNGRWWLGDSGLQLELDASYTDFEHELESLVNGQRFNLATQISQAWQGAFWFVKPALRLSHISYHLENSSDPENLNLATTSIDSGLFFERKLNSDLVQTLEPRLFYLNTPFKDQASTPVFDSSLPTFSFDRLFRHNRFTGGDRIADADQLTVALSSRIISSGTGDEYLRTSLGQIIYFDDRRVTLGGSGDSEQQSDLVAEIGSQLGHWKFRANWQWDNTTSSSERQNFLLRYQSDNNSLFNIAYRQQDSTVAANVIEQTDVSFMVPVSSSTSLFARWNYSIADKSDIDVIGGIGYESCCWSLKVIAQRNRIDETSNEYDNSIMLQLVLKGLGSVTGNRLANTLSNAIPGYEKTY